jgi:uncharacterized protein YuzE
MFSTEYDTDADALYIRLSESKVARTREFDTLTMVDEDSDGGAIGIEVIHPARPWPLETILESYSLTAEHRLYLTQLFPQQGRINVPMKGHTVGAAATRQLVSA